MLCTRRAHAAAHEIPTNTAQGPIDPKGDHPDDR